jgi:hypothetical protein
MPTIPNIRVDIDQNRETRVTDLDTGEVLDITDLQDASEHVQAAVYGQLVQIGTNVSTLRTQMKDQLERRFAEGVVESARFYGGVKLTRSAPRKWDPIRARTVLLRLAEEGEIAKARAEAAVPLIEVPKADGKKLNTILAELSGTDAGKDLASTKTDAVNWKAEPVKFDEPAADEPAPVAADPVDAFFGAKAA